MDAAYYLKREPKQDELTQNPVKEEGHLDPLMPDLGEDDGNDSDDDLEDSDDLDDDSDEEEVEYVEVDDLPPKPMQDFHCMLDAMLESYREVQGKPIKWRLPYKGKVREMEMIPFVLFVKGNTVEHDKHCGKYGLRNAGVTQLCRYCCTKTENTDEAYIKFKPKTQPMIQDLIDNKDEDGLKALSQHYIDNAWYQIMFGSHNNYGIHGNSPTEPLHWVDLGQFKYAREMFWAQTGDKTKLSEALNVLSQTIGIMMQ